MMMMMMMMMMRMRMMMICNIYLDSPEDGLCPMKHTSLDRHTRKHLLKCLSQCSLKISHKALKRSVL